MKRPWIYKMRTLKMNHMKESLEYNGLDIDDLPPAIQYSNNIEGLLKDWEDSSHVVINGVPIPVKYWKQVYSYSRPEVWNLIKNQWGIWKVSIPFDIHEVFVIIEIDFDCFPRDF